LFNVNFFLQEPVQEGTFNIHLKKFNSHA